jgi:hypothetical protein
MQNFKGKEVVELRGIEPLTSTMPSHGDINEINDLACQKTGHPREQNQGDNT